MSYAADLAQLHGELLELAGEQSRWLLAARQAALDPSDVDEQLNAEWFGWMYPGVAAQATAVRRALDQIDDTGQAPGEDEARTTLDAVTAAMRRLRRQVLPDCEEDK